MQKQIFILPINNLLPCCLKKSNLCESLPIRILQAMKKCQIIIPNVR